MNVSHQAFRHEPPIIFSERAVSYNDQPDFRKPGLDYLESLHHKGETISRVEPSKEQQVLFTIVELRQFEYIRTEFGDVDSVWYYPGVYFEKWDESVYTAPRNSYLPVQLVYELLLDHVLQQRVPQTSVEIRVKGADRRAFCVEQGKHRQGWNERRMKMKQVESFTLQDLF